MSDFKVGDEVIVLSSAYYAQLSIGKIFTVFANDYKDDSYYKNFSHGFIDEDGEVWITCGDRNFMSRDIRKVTKLDKALQ